MAFTNRTKVDKVFKNIDLEAKTWGRLKVFKKNPDTSQYMTFFLDFQPPHKMEIMAMSWLRLAKKHDNFPQA